jgi:hypothetical protein
LGLGLGVAWCVNIIVTMLYYILYNIGYIL